MFGWFRPTCPCDPVAKHWVENRLQWHSQQFGLHILLERSIILPTPEFFPDAWDGSPKAVRRLFRRVCQYMEVFKQGLRYLQETADSEFKPVRFRRSRQEDE